MEALAFLKRNRLAFTLVELLVVILVLGVLLAIALPSFLNAQDSAKDASAKTKLSTAYKGVKVFAGAHESAYPTGSDLVSAVNEAQPGLMNEGDPSSTADGKVGVCSESSSSEVKLVAVSASGTSFLMTTTASTGAYTIEPGTCNASPPDPINDVTTNAIPGQSGTIYFQRTKTPAPPDSGGYPIAVGSVAADGTGFTGSSWLTGFTSLFSVGFTSSYNAQTLLTMPNNTSLLTWAAPDGSNLHQDFDADAACESISGNFTSNWDNVEVSPNGDAIRIYCDGDKFVNVNASSGAVSEWTSPWDGQWVGGSGYLPWGQSWKLSPDGTKRVGTPVVLVNTDNGVQYVQNGVWKVPDGGAAPYTASGTQIVAPFSNSPYDSEWGATWSRDGSKVGWFRLDDSAGKYYVMIADADGDNLVSIEAPNQWGNYLVFSPDGQWVVYSVGNPSTGIGLEAVKTDGTGSPVTLASTVQGVRLEPLAWTGTGESFASFQN